MPSLLGGDESIGVKVSTKADTRGLDDTSRSLDRLDSSGKKTSGGLGKLTTVAKGAAIALGATITAGIFASVKASYDQVKSVEQATVALKAYEKDAGKVSSTLKDLIGYARSDMGVLFQRQDLFAAAQGLKIMGDRTEDLTDHVKIMSRSVGLGLSTFQGLGNVIQRVGSTGKLYADDLQFLQNAGYKLDSSLSGTTQTFDSLFKVLDKGIPADALAGQANTIQGRMIRLQSAFRDVGATILGVDTQTSTFIKGGLGDIFITGVDKAIVILKAMPPILKEIRNDFVNAYNAISVVATIVGNILAPIMKIFIEQVSGQLSPALKRLWDLVGPMLGPALKVLGVIIGGIVITSLLTLIAILTVTTKAFSLLISAISNGIQWAKNFANFFISAFVNTKNTVASSWSGMQSILTNPITKARDIIKSVIDQIQQWLNNITGKIDGFKNGVSNFGESIKSKIPGFATGTNYAPGGLATINERGPEQVILPRGARVIPADKTAQTMSKGVTMYNTYNVYNQMDLELAMFEQGWKLATI